MGEPLTHPPTLSHLTPSTHAHLSLSLSISLPPSLSLHLSPSLFSRKLFIGVQIRTIRGLSGSLLGSLERAWGAPLGPDCQRAVQLVSHVPYELCGKREHHKQKVDMAQDFARHLRLRLRMDMVVVEGRMLASLSTLLRIATRCSTLQHICD